jgi:hypothetical protein
MTSEPDSTSSRRPPTIELTATEVAADKPAAAAKAGDNAPAAEGARTGGATGRQSAEPAAGGHSGPRLYVITAFASIVAGALLVAVVGVGLWFAGYVPAREPVPSAQPSNNAAVTEISAQLKKIESSIQAQQPVQTPQPDPALASRLAAAEAATKSLGDSLAALNRRVDDVAVAAQNALDHAKAATTAADAAKNAAPPDVARGDVDALAARIAALEAAVNALATDVARRSASASADDRVARLTVAAEALRAAVERGVPYQAELAAAKSLGADQSAIAALAPFADAGVPSAAALAHELAALVPALQQTAEPAPANSTFLGRLESNAQRLVRITPVDAPAGDDPASVVTRIGVDAAHTDIAAALADIAKLPDAAKPVTAAWVQKAQARNAALAASRQLAANALAALAKPNPQ